MLIELAIMLMLACDKQMLTCSRAVYSATVKRPGLSEAAFCRPSGEYISRLKYRRALSKCLVTSPLAGPSREVSPGWSTVSMRHMRATPC